MFDQACCLIFYGFHVWMAHSDDLIQTHGNVARVRRKKKIPVVPVSYRKKIRVGRLEIIFFLNIYFIHFGSSLQPPGENRVARSIALKK
jgi:hypothetical protein